MSNSRVTIIPSIKARTYMDGPELCREYVKVPEMWLGTSTLPPGQRGNVDPGHPNSVEVFYVCTGHVLLFDDQQYYELFPGDSILISKNLPHTLINIGEDTAVLVWAGAPGQ